MERFKLSRQELYSLPNRTIENMLLLIEADGKAQQGAMKK
jgi:hypothetical protein